MSSIEDSLSETESSQFGSEDEKIEIEGTDGALTCVTAKNASVEINLKTLIQAPSAHIRFCLKRRFFFSSLAYRPHALGESDHRKRIFSKTLSRVKIFDKRWPLVYARKDENGRGFRIVFDVVHHLLLP